VFPVFDPSSASMEINSKILDSCTEGTEQTKLVTVGLQSHA